MTDGEELDVLSINSIRCLAIDAIERASSGHPGAPMGLAPVGYTLWQRFLRHNPGNPEWPGRDRFVLSAGHASMLVYSLLYLTGYDLSPEDLMAFRQLGSRTPGHPEYGHTAGVEVTTGPLGQGISNAVGMALARELVRARFNRPGYDLGGYYVYVIASDGDLMEGVASEACSLAGHLGLGRLIVLYDDNHITIEGTTALSFSEDVAGRFSAYGWAVQRVSDANDVEAVADAITAARLEDSAPSLIMVHSHIACGSPNLEGSEESHGAPLGADEAILTKENLGWASGEFCVPGEVLLNMRKALQLGAALEGEWNEMMDSYTSEYPAEAEEYRRVTACRLPEGWEEQLPAFENGTKVSTRGASGKVLASLAGVMPELVGGSADLGPSNKTFIKGYGSVGRGDFSGRNIHFGVREHGMAAIMNGMARHGGIIPYGGTFLVFADYMRPAIRMAALMGLKVVYVFTHDSLGVGEDGPTHQPIEQLASLRAMPDLVVIRPADANETSVAWRVALTRNGPTALALSRQDLPVLDRVELAAAEGLLRGAYVLAGSEVPGLTLVGTGSEVALALEARAALAADGINARVVSMPSWELFDEQDAEYRSSVLPRGDRILSVEAGVTMGWRRYVGDSGDVIGFDRFGMSAPGGIALAEAGFTVENVVERAKALLR
ncbi:MAG: transketolase [Actinobacteria bacterium]|nr:transketolase [Actinomycetota bacterium]MBU1944992.1 transketolase [Actinomycetota bacterium]MBU2688473.1 transketolase [Actinomycetota bacterium]